MVSFRSLTVLPCMKMWIVRMIVVLKGDLACRNSKEKQPATQNIPALHIHVTYMQVSYDGVYGYQNIKVIKWFGVWKGFGLAMEVTSLWNGRKLLQSCRCWKPLCPGRGKKMHKGLFAIQHPKIEKLGVNPCIRWQSQNLLCRSQTPQYRTQTHISNITLKAQIHYLVCQSRQ